MTDDDPAKRLLTIAQAAEAVNVTPKRIKDWIARGLLTPKYGKLIELDVLKVERDTRRKARMRELLRRAGVP